MPAAWVGAAVALYGAVSGPSKGSGGYSSDTQQNMQAADPFSGQRFQYQQALAKLMGVSYAPSGMDAQLEALHKSGAVSGAPGGIGSGTGYIYQPGITGPQASNPTGATGGIFDPLHGKSGANFVSSDPSYNFRLQSGSEAIQRAMGAKGMNGSGNMMAALMQYGQNLASTEYQNDFLRSETTFQNNFNNLALLSGASSGSPGAAGQLGLQGQQMQQGNDAATLAQWNKWLQPAAKKVGGWLNSSNSSSAGGGGDAGAGSDNGGASSDYGSGASSDPFADTSYTL